jgi:glycosyltransferase involved in cell wall biosynthesis
MRALGVGIISREYPPFFGGGIGSYTERFSRALAAAGHRVVVITASGDGRESRDVREGVTVVRLPFIKSERGAEDWSGPHEAIASASTRAAFAQLSPVSVLSMQAARALPRLVEEFGLDIIETPDTGALGWFALNARRLGRPCGARGWPAFVTHIHSPTAWIERLDRAPQVGRAHAELKRMERDVVRWADGLVCPSHGVAEWTEEQLGLERGAVEVIPLPLGELDSPAAARIPQAGPRRVLYVGRLEVRKGIDVLLAAFSRAVEGGADLRLDLAGRDCVDVRTGRPFGERCLEQLVSREARTRISVHGNVPPSRLAELRRSADFGVAPAPGDNFPYSCVEAMATGLPVIAARAGGMAEMITGDGDGLLFAPGDVGDCAAALTRAARMSAAEAAAMGQGARRRIMALCGTGGVIRERLAHFERVIDGPRNLPRRRERGGIVVLGPEQGAEPLREAVASGADFAHGWTDVPGVVRAFGTPTLAGLAAGPRAIGPVAVAAEVLEKAGPVDWRDPWEVATALAEAGFEGAVVPDCLSPATGGSAPWPDAKGRAASDLCQELGPAMVGALAGIAGAGRIGEGEFWRGRAERAEGALAAIKASRGWRWLERVYAVLHVLRGRGRGGGT